MLPVEIGWLNIVMIDQNQAANTASAQHYGQVGAQPPRSSYANPRIGKPCELIRPEMGCKTGKQVIFRQGDLPSLSKRPGSRF